MCNWRSELFYKEKKTKLNETIFEAKFSTFLSSIDVNLFQMLIFIRINFSTIPYDFFKLKTEQKREKQSQAYFY